MFLWVGPVRFPGSVQARDDPPRIWPARGERGRRCVVSSRAVRGEPRYGWVTVGGERPFRSVKSCALFTPESVALGCTRDERNR